jgi:tetratricopeptide (TPR) repeat protein
MLKWFNALSYFCFVLVVSALISTQSSAQSSLQRSAKNNIKGNAQSPLQQARETNSVHLEKAYQQVLYEYYQGNFSLALTQMAILEQKFPNGLRHIPDFLRANQVEPELLKGGISLAYGLDNQAADIFLRLLKKNTAPDVTAYSWLLLGKTYYQKRQFSDAAQAFQKISQDNAEEFFDQSTRDNWFYMQSQLHGFLLDQQPDPNNIKWLEQLSGDSIYRNYVQYNQALALLQKGQNQQAMTSLFVLTNSENSFIRRWMNWSDPILNATDEQDVEAERDAIRDRANLTLGYTLLQNDKPHDAFRVFEKIRTDGLDSEAALLGYGWAAAKKNDLQIALAIWQRLIHMPQNSEYTLEAYLASAYAYEKAFAPRQSLQVLQQGLNRFEQALLGLNQAVQKVNQRQFILDLLPNANKQQTVDDDVRLLLDDKGQSFKSLKPFNTGQLFNSVAVTSEFRAGLSALEQSRDLQQQLLEWQQRMQQYHLMLDERQAERLKRAKQISQNRTLEQLPALQIKRDALAQIIDMAKHQQDGQIFMSLQSQQWLDRVKRSEKRLGTIARLKTQLGQLPLKDNYQRRVERVAGRLVWQASEAYSANQWQAQKALNQLDTEITKAQQRQQKLLNQLAAKPDFAEQKLRVSNLAKLIDTKIAKNNGLQDVLISQLSNMFNQFIQVHKQKVSHYILQAKLAMVRLNDQALQKDNDSSIPLNQEPANQASTNEVDQL